MFNKKNKLGDIVLADHNLLLVLERFGIRLGFGDRTAEDVCSEYGISSELFVLICNMYSFENYVPDIRQLEPVDLKDLLSYLKNSHKYYVEKRLPVIGKNLDKIISGLEPHYAGALEHFFEDYREEVENHLSYEDEVVFPYVQNLWISPKGKPGFTINTFKENHSNIEDKLDDLKNILIKYLRDKGDFEVRKLILSDLFVFDNDLNKHRLIEEKILIPMVLKIERDE